MNLADKDNFDKEVDAYIFSLHSINQSIKNPRWGWLCAASFIDRIVIIPVGHAHTNMNNEIHTNMNNEMIYHYIIKC